jgi:hypothetical protein
MCRSSCKCTEEARIEVTSRVGSALGGVCKTLWPKRVTGCAPSREFSVYVWCGSAGTVERFWIQVVYAVQILQTVDLSVRIGGF